MSFAVTKLYIAWNGTLVIHYQNKLHNLRIIKIGNQIRNVKFGYQFLPLSSSLPSISFHFLPIPFFVKPKQYRALHYGKAVQC